MKKRGYPIEPGEHAHRIAQELYSINLAGNLLPASWVRNLVYDSSNRPNVIAAVILADIVYFSRPIITRPKKGDPAVLRKKYRADLLQQSYRYFAEKFGFTKLQVKKAIRYLEQKGLIWTEFRTVTLKGGLRANNVMYIGLNPDALLAITDRAYEPGIGEPNDSNKPASISETNNLSDSTVIAGEFDNETNTKITQQTTAETKEDNDHIDNYKSTDRDRNVSESQAQEPEHEMIQALGRVLVEDPRLNQARFKIFAHQLIGSGYSATQLEVWYSHPDKFDSIKDRYGSKVVEMIPNHSWYFNHHWAYVSNYPGQYPTEKRIRESIVKASEGISMAGSFKKDASSEYIHTDPDFSFTPELAPELEGLDLGPIDFDTPIDIDYLIEGKALPALMSGNED